MTTALWIALSALALTPGETPSKVQRPNILWLIAEDFSLDLGCYGATQVSTPNIDALAAQGMRFTQAYTTAPVCSASRSAFMTGMYQTTIGAHNHRSHRGDGYRLPEGVRLLTDRMRDAGYFTDNVVTFPKPIGFRGSGKTDWNFTPPAHPFDSKAWSDLKGHQPFLRRSIFRRPTARFVRRNTPIRPRSTCRRSILITPLPEKTGRSTWTRRPSSIGKLA